MNTQTATDAIALKVKQEFAAKEKSRIGTKAPAKATAAKLERMA